MFNLNFKLILFLFIHFKQLFFNKCFNLLVLDPLKDSNPEVF